MRQMMGFFQVSEHRQDREIPWSQSQIADYGEWWCSDLQDLAAKPTLWWSILCFVRARKHSWCTTHVRWPKRCGEEKQQGLNGSLCQGIIDVQNMKLCYVRFGKVQLWLVVGILQINYRSTTDLAVTMSPLAFHLAVFHVRRRRNWPVFSIDWAWPISFPSSSPKTPNFNSLLAGNVVEIYWNAQDDDKDGLCVSICLMLFDS